MLNRVRQPFNVNALAQAAALAALADTDYVAQSRAINREGMQALEAGFRALGLSWVPSHANFLLVRVGDAGRVYQQLLRRGVIVRPVANYGLPEWLRVTVGLPEENRRFAWHRIDDRAVVAEEVGCGRPLVHRSLVSGDVDGQCGHGGVAPPDG